MRSWGIYTPSKKCRRFSLFAVVSDLRLARSTHCLENFRQRSILKYDCQSRRVKDERCRLSLKKDPLNEPRFSSWHRSLRFRHHGPLVVCQNRNYTAHSGLRCDRVHIPATADLESYISGKSSLRLQFCESTSVFKSRRNRDRWRLGLKWRKYWCRRSSYSCILWSSLRLRLLVSLKRLFIAVFPSIIERAGWIYVCTTKLMFPPA